MKKTFILTFALFGFFILSADAQHNAFLSKSNSVPYDTNSNRLLIPNAFTPNGDGKNDLFKIDNFTDQELLEFKIFNRWGTILFTTEDPSIGWDGTYKGKKQPFGVYGYVIRIVYAQNVVETYKGTVTLLR